MYPDTIPAINELTICREFGWSLAEVRALPIIDFGNAIGFISGVNKGKIPDDVTIVED